MALKDKISELILKLSLSGLPPSFQELVINHLGDLDDGQLTNFILILDELAGTEFQYLQAAEKYQEFYRRLSDDVKEKLQSEADKIQEEVLEELIRNQK